MKVRFWGVRSSIPVPGPTTVKYGGNTSCIEVRSQNDDILIIDAGSGIRELGYYIINNDLPDKNFNINILLSHTHTSHIQGIPYFNPLYLPYCMVTFYGPCNALGSNLKDIIAIPMGYSFNPISLNGMPAETEFIEIGEDTFQIGPFNISTCYLNHSSISLGYKIECDGKILVTLFDHEPYRNIFTNSFDSPHIDEEIVSNGEAVVKEQNQCTINFAKGSDFLIADAKYTSEEYPKKIGHGHSSMEHALKIGTASQCKKLAFFSHDPIRTDSELDTLQMEMIDKVTKMGFGKIMVFFARELLEINL